jgi:hypothetical protein
MEMIGVQRGRRIWTAGLVRPAMGVAGTVVAAAMLGAPAVQATPSPARDAQAASCGDTPGDWAGVRLSGTQYHDNDPAKDSLESTFKVGTKTVTWSIILKTFGYGTVDTDAYWVSGPGTIEFSSDLGKGNGNFWRFRLTARACDSGKVTSATVDTYIPPIQFVFTNPTTHYGTWVSRPLRGGVPHLLPG